MPNYRTHSVTNLFLILPLAYTGAAYFFKPTQEEAATFIGCFTYATLFMSPDVDLAYQNKLFSLKGVLTLPFRLYALIFSHRGLSHMPIIGTLTRLIYLAAISIIVYGMVNQVFPSFPLILDFIKNHDLLIFWGISGAFMADLAHEALDNLSL
jgi:uncharacterized metal-binding protein